MASSVGAFAGAVSRHWTIQEEGRTYHLELTHNTVLGTRSLSIDGCDVPGGCGSFFATSSPQTMYVILVPVVVHIAMIQNDLLYLPYDE